MCFNLCHWENSPKTPCSSMKKYNIGAPMERVAVDVLGPLPESYSSNILTFWRCTLSLELTRPGLRPCTPNQTAWWNATIKLWGRCLRSSPQRISGIGTSISLCSWWHTVPQCTKLRDVPQAWWCWGGRLQCPSIYCLAARSPTPWSTRPTMQRSCDAEWRRCTTSQETTSRSRRTSRSAITTIGGAPEHLP